MEYIFLLTDIIIRAFGRNILPDNQVTLMYISAVAAAFEISLLVRNPFPWLCDRACYKAGMPTIINFNGNCIGFSCICWSLHPMTW